MDAARQCLGEVWVTKGPSGCNAAAGCVPELVPARKAKLMMGEINKTDKLDV